MHLAVAFALAGGLAGCGSDPTQASSTGPILANGGDGQIGIVGSVLAQPLSVVVHDRSGAPAADSTVQWSVVSGVGTLSAASSVTDAGGIASVTLTLGSTRGPVTVEARLATISASVLFTELADLQFTVLGGGNNVPERYGSDLWVAGGYAYTGTWGGYPRGGVPGNAVKIWQLGLSGALTLVDSIVTPDISTVSDLEVSPDSLWLVFSTEGGLNSGLWVYSLANPAAPTLVANFLVSFGVHTSSLSVIGGKLYAFEARDPPFPTLMIFDLSQVASGTITLASSTPIPPYYGIHDTFVRKGLAFVCAWNNGLMIYDVGDGRNGGSPTSPQLISTVTTAGGETHNAWWFNNPTTGQAKYVFIGQEGPGTIGASSSGDIHVVDVSNLSSPVEVATYHMSGTSQSAGPHNFWMDESGEILYAAYYNGGVVALDVSGTLSGDLASREMARIQPGGSGNSYVWGVQLYGGSLYAVDMVSGFWQLSLPH